MQLHKVATALYFVCGLASVWACENSCSGHGECLLNDSCECQVGWTAAADCSLRNCPVSFAHHASPNGDFNYDGDRKDDSYIRVPSTTGTMSVTKNKKEVTLSVAVDAAYTTLTVGDGILLAGEMYIIATTPTTTSLTLDKVFTGATDAAIIAHKWSLNEEMPSWELWPGDASPDGDEGHFGQVCSNQGMCNHKTGTCKCFNGFSGSACQRSLCPKDCNGHGVCRSVDRLRQLFPILQPSCNVSAARGSDVLVTQGDCSGAIAVGDTIKAGDSPLPLLVHPDTAPTATAITLAQGQAVPKTLPPGSPLYLEAKYDLWDKHMLGSCVCDPSYFGPGCTQRKCPRGPDPFQAKNAAIKQEVQTIDVGGVDPANRVTGSFRLRFTDEQGKRWLTDSVPVDGGVDKSAQLAAALHAIPNGRVLGASVTSLPIGHDTAASAPGVRYYVSFGKHNGGDLPNMGCDTRGLTTRLESPVLGGSSSYSQAASGAHLVTFGSAVAGALLVAGDTLACYDGGGALVGDVTVLALTLSSGSSSVAAVSVSAAVTGATSFKTLRNVRGEVDCLVSDVTPMMPDPWAAGHVTASAADGSTTVTLSAPVGALTLAVGQLLLLRQSTSQSEIVLVSQLSGASVTISKPIFGGTYSSAAVFLYGKGTSESKECAGRGKCDRKTALCNCYRGYIGYNCGTIDTTPAPIVLQTAKKTGFF